MMTTVMAAVTRKITHTVCSLRFLKTTLYISLFFYVTEQHKVQQKFQVEGKEKMTFNTGDKKN